MQNQKNLNYWLLQIKPADFRLLKALKVNELKVYPVKLLKTNIKKGDKIIIWKSGKNAGCYALATAASEAGEWPYPKSELPFFKKHPSIKSNVRLKINLNLWDKPLQKEHFSETKLFDRFAEELPGINYKVSERHYTFMSERAKENLLEIKKQKVFLPYHKTTDHPLSNRISISKY